MLKPSEKFPHMLGYPKRQSQGSQKREHFQSVGDIVSSPESVLPDGRGCTRGPHAMSGP